MYDPTIPAPRTQLLEGIAYEQYRLINATTTSELKQFEFSPRHFFHALHQPERVGDPLKLGCAFDELVEHGGLSEKWHILPELNLRTKYARAVRDEAIATYGARNVLTVDQALAAHTMYESYLRDDNAQGIASEITNYQTTLVWTDSVSELPRKGRPDAIAKNNKGIYLVDYKSIATQFIHPQVIGRYMLRFGYHLQAAAYIDGARANDLDPHSFWFIFVESSEPWTVVCYQLSPESIEAGRIELRRRQCDLMRCLDSGKWPGYAPQMVSIPRWAGGGAEDTAEPVEHEQYF